MRIFSCLLLLLSLGCGDDAAFIPFDGGPTDAGMDAAPFDASADAQVDSTVASDEVAARLYQDEGGDDRTRRLNGFDPEDSPVVGANVRLHGNGAPQDALTDADGFVRFSGLAPGSYYLDVGQDEATSHNVAPQVASAVDAGAIKITTFGDSLPVFGGVPRFDAVLSSHFDALAAVDGVNLAVAGSTSLQWGAGTRFFDALEPEIAGTDLFVVSLGGNDFVAYIQGLFAMGGMDAVLGALDGAARDEALNILERVIAIIDSIRAQNAEADFVFLLYPDYPSSTFWQNLIISAVGPSLADGARLLIMNEYASIQRALLERLRDEDIVLVDLYRQTIAEPIDPFVIDEVHFTAFGHQRVGEEIFLSLGGTIVGAEPSLQAVYEVGIVSE